MGGIQSDINVSYNTRLTEFETLLKNSHYTHWKIYSPDNNIKIFCVIFTEIHGDVYFKYTFKKNLIYNISKTYVKNACIFSRHDFMVITLKDGQNHEKLLKYIKCYSTCYEKLNKNTYKIDETIYKKIKISNIIEDVYYFDD